MEDTIADRMAGSQAVLEQPGQARPVKTTDGFFTRTASFARPADTTAYAIGDRVGNSTSAAVVLELTDISRDAGEGVRIERVRLRKTATLLTNAQFRVHLFRTAPTVSANDNAQFNNSGALTLADIAGYLGYADVTMDLSATIGARGVAAPAAGAIICEPAGAEGHETSLWAVIEARAAYVPASAETFTVTLEAVRS